MMGNRRGVALLFAVSFLQGLCFYAPVATLYRQAVGLTLLDITLTETLCAALMLLLEIPWGWLADRLGHRRTIILCTIVYALSKVVFWRAQVLGDFMAERVLLAVVLSGLSGCDSAYLYACAGGGAQRLFGRWEACSTAGLFTAGLCSTLFLGDNYRLAALWTVVTYAAAALCTLFLPKLPQEAAPQRRPRPSLTLALRRTATLVPFLLGAALLAETAQFVTTFLSQVLYRAVGIAPRWLGLLYAAATLVSLLGAHSHRLTQRLGARRGGLVLFAGAGGACLAMALLPHPLVAVAGVMTLRVCAALFYPLSLAQQNRQAAAWGEGVATQLSCNAMVLNLVGAGLNPAFGRVADLGPALALLLGALCCLIGAFCFLQGIGSTCS